MPPVRPAGNRRRAFTLATGLAIAGLLAALDLAVGSSHVLIGLVIFAPLVSGLFGDPRDVGIVGTVALALIALSALWNDSVDDGTYVQRLVVCVVITFIAVLAARNRERTHRDRERFSVLAATGEIADGTRDLETTVAALNELLVPTIADICIVDAVSAGEIRRLAVRAAGPRGDEIAAAFAARAPLLPDDPRLPAAAVSRRRVSTTRCCTTSPTTSASSSTCARRRSAPRSPCRCAPAAAGSAR